MRLCLEFCHEYNIFSTEKLEELMNFRQIKKSKTKTEIFIQLMLIISKSMDNIIKNKDFPNNNIQDSVSVEEDMIEKIGHKLNSSMNTKQREALIIAGNLKKRLFKKRMSLKRSSTIKTLRKEENNINEIVSQYQNNLKNINITSIGKYMVVIITQSTSIVIGRS